MDETVGATTLRLGTDVDAHLQEKTADEEAAETVSSDDSAGRTCVDVIMVNLGPPFRKLDGSTEAHLSVTPIGSGSFL
jgi:hypothetical protein